MAVHGSAWQASDSKQQCKNLLICLFVLIFYSKPNVAQAQATLI